MKVLIITYYWPPAGGSGVQRWLKFVKYLTQLGIDLTIYTVDNPNYAIEDKTLQQEVPESVKTLKQPIREPNGFLNFFGSKNKKISAGFLKENPSFLDKVMQYIRANFFIPDARKFWIKPSVHYLKDYLKKNPIDIVITTGPPHSLHLIGLALQEEIFENSKTKWIADFRDPWTDIDYFHQLPLTTKTIKKHQQLEKEVVSAADCVLVVGNTMKQNFIKFNKNIEVITNGYDGDLNTGRGPLDKKFTLVHIGLVNADRNPKILFKVLSELKVENTSFAEDLEMVFVGKLANEVVQSIDKLKSNTKIVDYIPHHQVLEFQRKAQILVLLVNNVPSAKGIITGKVFEYLQAQRPILAIGPTNGDLAEIIEITNSGSVIDFDDEKALKNKILEMYNLYKTNDLNCKSKDIEQYHRKHLAKELIRIFNKMIK